MRLQEVQRRAGAELKDWCIHGCCYFRNSCVVPLVVAVVLLHRMQVVVGRLQVQMEIDIRRVFLS